MIVRICQPAAVHKMRVFHAQSLRLFIHCIYKLRFAACNMFCHSHAGIVSGSDHNTFDHGLHRLGFSFLQKNLGASHRFGMSACCNRIIQFQISFFYFFKNKKKSHNLCNTGGTSWNVFVFFQDHRPCFRLHQHIFRSLHRNCRGSFFRRYRRCQRKKDTCAKYPGTKKVPPFFSHRKPPVWVFYSILKGETRKYDCFFKNHRRGANTRRIL